MNDLILENTMFGACRRRVLRSSVCVLSAVAMGIVLASCSGDTIGTAPLVTSAVLFNVTLNQHAINMALTGPSSIMQLTAVGTTASGDSVAVPIHPTFVATDSSVTVSAKGLVTAHYVTQYGGTQVIATVQQNNVTYTDTAFIQVTATAPTRGLKTFSIGDSVSLAYFPQESYVPSVQAYDSADQPMLFSTTVGTGAQNVFWLESSNPSVADVSPRRPDLSRFTLNTVGYVTVYATAWVYGVAVKDSLVLNIGLPLHVNNIFDNFFDSLWDKYSIILGAGGVIDWYYYDGGNFEIVFDDSAAVDSAPNGYPGIYQGSGNIHWPSLVGNNDQARSFPIPGVYHFHDLLNPTMIGTITVLKNTP